MKNKFKIVSLQTQNHLNVQLKIYLLILLRVDISQLFIIIFRNLKNSKPLKPLKYQNDQIKFLKINNYENPTKKIKSKKLDYLKKLGLVQIWSFWYFEGSKVSNSWNFGLLTIDPEDETYNKGFKRYDNKYTHIIFCPNKSFYHIMSL